MLKISIKLLVICFTAFVAFQFIQSNVVNASAANVYDTTNLGYDQSIIARTAQGIVNRSTSAAAPLYIDTNIWGYQNTATAWKNYFTSTKGYTLTRQNTLDDLLKTYKTSISGLAVYDLNTDATRWIAETYSGINNTLPVDESMVDVAFQDNFTTYTGWTTGGNSGASASSDGDNLNIQTGTAGTYALVYRNVTVNVDTYQYLQLNVKSLTAGASWYINAYYNGTTYTLPSWSTATGVYTVDLKQTTGWTGTITFQLIVGVQGGASKTVSIDWLHIGEYGFADNFWAITGWTVGSPTGTGTLTTDGATATLSTGSTSSYAVMARTLTVNLDDYSYIHVHVTAASSPNWYVDVYDPVAHVDYPMYPSTQTGDFLFQIGANTNGKRGIQTLQFELVANGGVNSSVSFNYYAVGRNPLEEGNYINSFPISTDLRTHNWTDDTTAYNWAITNLSPSTDQQVGYHIGDEEYASDSGRWQAVSLDIAISKKAFCFRLPPYMTEAQKDTLFTTILNSFTNPAAIYGGWANALPDTVGGTSGEQKFITYIAQHGDYAILSTGTSGSFLAKIPVGTVSFNQTRTISPGTLDASKYYVAFMTAEGDTFASPEDFISGNWLDSGRGTVPINWMWDPLFQAKFPAMAEYYRNTATSDDYFYGFTGYTFLTEMSSAQQTTYGSFVKTQLDNANIAVEDAWDTHFNLSAYNTFTTNANLSAITQGIMPGAVDSSDGSANARVWTLSNGTPFVTPEFALMYVTKNADGSALTSAGLASLIETEAANHKKPFFLKVFVNTYKIGNSTFDEHLPTALAATQTDLGTTDYKVVKLDEFVGALKTAFNFQDDFAYKSTIWGVGPTGASFNVASGKATLSSGTNTYGLIHQSVTVDVAKHPYISINVPRLDAGANWSVNVYDGTTTWRMPNGGNTGTGTFNYDIRTATGWTTGVHTFDFQIAVNGTNKSMDIDWVRIGSIQN